MKISATFSTGDYADNAVRDIKKAGISIFSKKSIPLDYFTPTPSRIEEMMYFPGQDYVSQGVGMLPYNFPPTAPPMGVFGDEPLNPDRGGRTRLDITVEERSKNSVRGILVANNATDIHFHP